MRKQTVNTLLSALALSGQAFSRPEYDAMRVPEPVGGSFICGVTRDPSARGFLLAPEGDPPAPGNEDVKFDEKQQAKLNALLAAERQKGKAAIEAVQKQLDEVKLQTAKIAEEAEQKAAADAKAKEELELSKLDATKQSEYQIKKGAETIKSLEAQIAKAKTDHESAIKAERDSLNGYVKLTHAVSALGSLVAEGAADVAASRFLQVVQVETDENHKFKQAVYNGNVFETPAKAAQAFLQDHQYFAKPPEGGGGGPRRTGGAGGGDLKGLTTTALVGAGLQEAPYGS